MNTARPWSWRVVLVGGALAAGCAPALEVDLGPRARNLTEESTLERRGDELVLGAYHSCAIAVGGTVRCWGDNLYSQLGDAAVGSHRSTPGVVAGLTGVTSLAAGALHTCAVLSDSTVRCWGRGTEGQLGDNNRVNRATPVTVLDWTGATLTGVTSLAAGRDHTCARLRDGRARCWGGNSRGQLGLGTTADKLTATRVLSSSGAFLAGVTQIVAGLEHTCFLLELGAVACVGNNASGQLGVGDYGNRSLPTTVPALTNVRQLTAGYAHTCAMVPAVQSLRCWGDNSQRQLSGSTAPAELRPFTIPQTVEHASAGAYHTCVKQFGQVYCFGSNQSGELGRGTTGLSAPWGVMLGTEEESTIFAGFYRTCLRDGDGLVRCTGVNTSGQLGVGGTTSTSTLELVAGLSLVPPPGIAAGGASDGAGHTCVVRADGRLSCWGHDEDGQVGDGAPLAAAGTAQLAHIENVLSVDAGGRHTCAVTGAGAVYCWGDASFSQLGDGLGIRRTTPQRTRSLGAEEALSVAAGDRHTCALTAAGNVWCWGDNAYGQGRVGGVAILTAPTATPVTNALQVCAGGSHSCAVLASGSVQCWGRNNVLQLGTIAPSTTGPTTVPDVTGVIDLACGGDFTCVLRRTGQVVCWGGNANGQLGDGSVSVRNLPATVRNITGVTSLTAGDSHACAITAEGTAWCWGRASSGQLGSSSALLSTSPPLLINYSAVPLRVSGSLRWAALSAGRVHTCGIMDTGATACWGSNEGGQVGSVATLGTGVRATPVGITVP